MARRLRKIATHDTALVQKHALVGEVLSDFHEGDRVMTADGIAGQVTAVLDGPYPGTESYTVVLDDGLGGGEYSPGLLRPLVANAATASASEAALVVATLPVEATTEHDASVDYPELGSILSDRLPIENVRVTASRTVLSDSQDDADDSTGVDNPTDDDQTEPMDSGAAALPQVEMPSACSFCGNDSFSDPQTTGRGLRVRCDQCDGTMSSWGGQWQPEFPNSPANNASEQWDYRSGGPGGVVQAPGVNYKVTSLDGEFGFHLTATWMDVQAKARRIRVDGGVKILAARGDFVVGEVKGDTAVYETQLNYLPGSKRVADWHCGCKWGSYTWGRSKPFARFEGRLCSHGLALQYEAAARGMFGKDVQPDRERPSWQKAHQPVVVEFNKNTDRNVTRRVVPPGNMKRVFTSLNPDTDGVYPEDHALDLHHAPVYAYVEQGFEHGASVEDILEALASFGVETSDAASMIVEASHGQHEPLTHKKHKTDDAREHAPIWGWGVPWGIPLGMCSQCNGQGCGHCGGTGQTQTTPSDQPNADPIPDQSPDAGQDFQDGGEGFSSTGVFEVLADYAANDPMTGADAGQKYDAPVRHSDSENPASTGWATSEDSDTWDHGLFPGSFGRSFDAAKKDSVDEAPTVSGVALKAADTGRVLMIQRSLKDDKDPAAGTWEFPGGHHEEGDKTSLHAGIREWEEETGHEFPEGGHVAHTWRSGPYQGHVVVVPSEDALKFHEGRSTVNPDDPDGDDHEQSAWWHPGDAKKNPALRDELKKNGPFGEIEKAAVEQTLHDEPEGALPSTDGAEETPEQIIAAFQATAGAQVMAREAGIQTVAMKTFTTAEQKELISEGIGDRARNFGDLDIAGTHYAQIEAGDFADDETVLWG